MSERATAADLQLDACLREVFGEAPAPGLAERIALRMRSGPDAAAQSSWRGRLLAAALLLGGGAAVAGVAWLRHEEQNRAAAPPPQEPQGPPGKDAPPNDQRLDQNAALVGVVAEALRGLAHADHRDDALALLTVLGEQGRLDELDTLTRRLAKSLGVDEAVAQTAVDTVQRGAALQAHPPGREQITKWLRDLAVAGQRADARNDLLRASQYAILLASEALAQEEQAVLSRADVVAELQSLVPDLRSANQRLAEARGRLFGVTHVTTGNTLISDYSDNRVIEVDRDGRIVWEIDDIYGAWDARLLPNGNLLLTEFSVSRVSEVDRKGNRVWVYEDLKNPYRASRLPNGNTLIADTFNGRVIEVTPEKQVVWKYAGIRPFGAERLASGNTLIADVLMDRVLEVDPQGAIVWQVGNMNNVHDAKRLPNGRTLITLRSVGTVIEVDRDGKVVWKLEKLMAPSSAERLPNGNTLVAENNAVREFDPQGAVVWKQQMTWAVSARRY